MKKFFILIFSLLAIFLYGQEAKSKNSHWSITLEGGVNRFDGDITQHDKTVSTTANNKLTSGGSLEYTLTPVWSIGVEYYNLPISAKGSHYSLTDNMNTADAFFCLNFIKWFYPRSTSKWGLWASVGGGVALYDVNYQTSRDGYVDNHGNIDEDYVRTNRWAITVPVWALIEYNFSKNLALGTKIQYRSYNKDNLDGRIYFGVTNDFVSMATLQLRWKFNAHKHDHTRNINTNTFNDINCPTEGGKANNAPDSLKVRVDSLQKQLNELQSQMKKMDQMAANGQDTDGDGIPDYLDKEPNTPKGSRVDSHGVKTQIMGNARNKKYSDTGLDSDEDGVPDDRDLEPNTPKGRAVDFYGREVKTQVNADGYAEVFFDFDKCDLDEEAHATIRNVAEKMQKDPMLTVEVRGYCDYLGSVEYNYRLSQNRANIVTQELVEKYGIGRYRIIANGKGRLPEPQKAFRENRRCDFFFDR